MTVRLAPVDTWPDVRITVHLLPWSWRRALADAALTADQPTPASVSNGAVAASPRRDLKLDCAPTFPTKETDGPPR